MAVSCLLNKDLLRSTSCGYSLPEVKTIYLANMEDVSATTVSAGTGASEGCEEIATIAMVEGKRFFEIEPARDSVTFEDALATGSTGNKYRTQSITFTVNGQYDACMHGVLDALSLGRFFVVVLTAEGNMLGLGRVAGLEAEAAALNGGGDNAGIVITLSGNVTESSLPLSAAAEAVVRAKN